MDEVQLQNNRCKLSGRNRPVSYSGKEPGIKRYFYTFSFARFDRVALELLSILGTFENSTKCSKVSFY